MRSVIELGKGLAVLLTKELKALDIEESTASAEKKGRNVGVDVFFDKGKIIITTSSLSHLRPVGISDESWRNFLAYLIKKYGEEGLAESIGREIEDALEKKTEGLKITLFGKEIT